MGLPPSLSLSPLLSFSPFHSSDSRGQPMNREQPGATRLLLNNCHIYRRRLTSRPKQTPRRWVHVMAISSARSLIADSLRRNENERSIHARHISFLRPIVANSATEWRDSDRASIAYKDQSRRDGIADDFLAYCNLTQSYATICIGLACDNIAIRVDARACVICDFCYF